MSRGKKKGPHQIIGPVIACGEAMIELSDITDDGAQLGVAGDTYNTAVYMARAGAPVSFATAVGVDKFSERIISAIEAEGIGTELIFPRQDLTVGLYAVEVDDWGERSFTYWRSTSAAREALSGRHGEMLAKKMSSAGLLYVSGITLAVIGEEGRQRLIGVARTIRQQGGHVAFDTNYRPAGWESPMAARAAIEALQPFISVALPTFEDDEALYGDRDPQDCAERWAASGAEEVVVKSGPDGAYLEGYGWVAPPEILSPLDTTGAGDSFNGAYLAARLRGAEPAMAIRNAHALAGRVLMTHGAILPRST